MPARRSAQSPLAWLVLSSAASLASCTEQPPAKTHPPSVTAPRDDPAPATDGGATATGPATLDAGAVPPEPAPLASGGPPVQAPVSVRVDGAVVGNIFMTRSKEGPLGVWSPGGAESKSARRFRGATQMFVSGVIDLATADRVPSFQAGTSTLTAVGMKQPLLVLWVVVEEPDPVGANDPFADRATHVATRRDLLLIDPHTGHAALRQTVSQHSGDGFGGFDLENLRVERPGGLFTLTATHQDHLSARHARCLKPEAYKVHFTWQGSSFVGPIDDRPASKPGELAERQSGCR